MRSLQELNMPASNRLAHDVVENEAAPVQGLIFDIDRYAIHDGPGVRCLVFMKGCPIRCLWCSNPEGQEFFPEVAYFPGKCIGCGTCVEACPQNAIEMVGGRPKTDWDLCKNCGACTEQCYAGARKLFGTTVSSDELFERVKRDIVFFRNSGGGVTIGGGEAVAQPEFVTEFLKICKGENLHTAIETCGYCPWKNLKEIAQYTDLVVYDIKQMDPEKHKMYTGVSNKRILENLIKLSRENVDLLIRIPVIPGHNEDEENIRLTTKFVMEELDLARFERLELLPYHKLGAFKYTRLGRTYSLNSLQAPSDEKMEALKKIVESFGLTCQVGG